MVVYSHLFRWSTFILSGVSCDDVEIEIYQFLFKSASNFSTNVSIWKNVKRHNAIWELLEPRNYFTFAENSRLTISSPTQYVRDISKKSSNFHHQLFELKSIIKIVFIKKWLHDTLIRKKKVALSLIHSVWTITSHGAADQFSSWSRKLFR